MTDGKKTLDEYKLISLRDVVFVNPLQDEHKCSKCQLLLEFPKQTSCGHRYCEGCIIKEILRFCSQQYSVLTCTYYSTVCRVQYSVLTYYSTACKGRSCELLHSIQMYTHANACACRTVNICLQKTVMILYFFL